MSQEISESSVYQALKLIKHPEIKNRNLVELGMIPEIRINGKRILVILALPNPEIPIKQILIDSVRQAAGGMGDGLEVEVSVTEMDAEQKKTFVAMAVESHVAAGPKGTISKVVAIMSGKGGVGKSSVAGLFASALRRRGLQVGILDADITGPSIPKVFGVVQNPEAGPEGILPVESRTGIKLMSINLLLPQEDQPVVWRGPLISRAIEQFWSEIVWGNLDYLIVDLPPGTSDAALTVMQSLPLDGIVLVTSPQDLAGMVVRKAANMGKHLGIPLIGLVENMSHIICPECGTKIYPFGDSRAQDTATLIVTTMIGHTPLDTQLAVQCDRGEIEDYFGDEFEAIVEKLIRLISGSNPQAGEAVDPSRMR